MPPAGCDPTPEYGANPRAEDRIPLVSVVVPMHNAGGRIAATLQSITSQTYPRLEMILVDDGSEDDTCSAASRTLRRESLTWRLFKTPHRGPSHARNVGWRAARGDLIQFLDDDDAIHPDKISIQMDWITARDNRKDAAIYSKWAIRDSRGEFVRHPRHANWQVHDVIRGDSFLPIASCLIQRTWLEAANGFDERLNLIEDVDLQIRILAAGGRFEEAPSDRPLFFYNQRPKSLSKSHPAVFADACLRNARLVYAIAVENGQLPPALVETVLDVYRGAISTYAQSDRTRFDAAYGEFRRRFPKAALHESGRVRYCGLFMGERRAEVLRGALRRTKRLVRDMLPALYRP